MAGNPIWSDRETDDTLRERCPTNEEFLREMAGIEFGPPYKQRFAEAADELESFRDIVATLPKCWRLVDGKPVQDCPVHDGMTYYTYCANARDIIEDQFAWDDYLCRATDHWANTREAAEALAAMRKEPE